MTQMDPYRRGFRKAARWAVTWLHAEAAQMNDPHAKAILNVAAFGMGVDLARHPVMAERSEPSE